MVNVSDFPEEYEESNGGADTGEETVTMLDPEADCTAYNDKTIAALEETLQSILEKVSKKDQEKNKRELDYSKASKVLVTAKKHFFVMNLCLLCVLWSHCPRIIKQLFLVIIFFYLVLDKLFCFRILYIYFVFAVALSSFIGSFYYVTFINTVMLPHV